MERIVIIGGGLSGTLVVINLLKLIPCDPIDITVIDRNPQSVLGVAYCTDKHFHLLNVPAGKMSAFPDKSDDFMNWLTDAGYSFQSSSFVPRKIYKEYIQQTLARELKEKGEKVRYMFLKDKASDVLPAQQVVLLESGRQVPFDKLVLAIGNFKPADLRLPDNGYLDHPRYYRSAWDTHLFSHLPKNKKVLIIGSGLTMVDTVLTLRDQRHIGNIVALSTHGYTPMAHGDSVPYQFNGLPSHYIRTSLEALKLVNAHLKKARQQGIAWHSVIDAIRPFTQQIWLNLPPAEKKIFMQHLRHLWGVARHRIPRESAALLYELLSAGQLRVVAGRIKSIGVSLENEFLIEYHERSSKRVTFLHAAVIVNCMGPESDYEKLEDPLVDNLLKRALIRTDVLKLGIDCTPEGAVIGKNGLPADWLYTIGPPAKGCLWEITSVPEIRTAALKLADLLLHAKDVLVS
jgi:uncharacterized NAD(P)/FAD-binding protein YdhS